ncbi:MAG: hypothetical protein K6B44_05440 [Lachnospiraceae bacterium]|nr:hypothetical protein [Lachnospiraceae bacterium]
MIGDISGVGSFIGDGVGRLISTAAGFITNYLPYMPLVLSVVFGVLLVFDGLGTFRRTYTLLCALLGLCAGLALHTIFRTDNFYIVAGLITIGCGILGHEHYKSALVIVASLGGFTAVTLFTLRRLNEDIKLAIQETQVVFQEMPDASSILRLWYKRLVNGGDVKAAAMEVFEKESGYTITRTLAPFAKAADAMQLGMGLAIITAVLLGLAVMILADYIIIASTAALGSVILVNVIETNLNILQLEYNYKLTILFVGGIIVQLIRFYSSIEKKTKKKRGLYDK